MPDCVYNIFNVQTKFSVIVPFDAALGCDLAASSGIPGGHAVRDHNIRSDQPDQQFADGEWPPAADRA